MFEKLGTFILHTQVGLVRGLFVPTKNNSKDTVLVTLSAYRFVSVFVPDLVSYFGECLQCWKSAGKKHNKNFCFKNIICAQYLGEESFKNFSFNFY